MFKQLALGEGGMAITDDDNLAAEINKRIIFGESPEVLSSNYRMTEFQAAVGVVQLKKVQGYLKEYSKGRKLLDEAIADCSWLDLREELPDSLVAPYFWSCLFHGDRSNIDYRVFKAALRQAGAGFGTGFLQVPAYMYAFLRNPNAYGDKGCPYNCHLYNGKVDWKSGLCPVAEDVIPRLVYTNNMVSVETTSSAARALKESIELTETGDVEPLDYTERDKHVLHIVKENGPVEPDEVIRIMDEKGLGHFDEHSMWVIMENLRDRSPYRLSHAGPRKFAYHDLS